MLKDSQSGMNYYATYMKKYPKDLWYKNMYAEMQKKYNSIREASAKNNANLIYIPKQINPVTKNHVPYKSKYSSSQTLKTDTKTDLMSYLPYIVMGCVILLVIFSQTSRTNRTTKTR